MHIAICDDDGTDRESLRARLKELRPDADVQEFGSAEALLEAHRAGTSFDLVFLDVYLQGMNGMEAARALRAADDRAALAFLTVSRDWAVESYDVAALSYLVKPVESRELAAALERFDATWRPRSIFIRDRFFATDDIVCAESRDKRVTFTFRNGATAEITAKLGEVEEQLRGRNFLRCHRSFIVNMDHVARLGDKCFVTATGNIVLIRQKAYAAMRKRYYDYVTSR